MQHITQDFVFSQGHELKTDSLKVAKAFGKRHHHVVRDVRDLVQRLINQLVISGRSHRVVDGMPLIKSSKESNQILTLFILRHRVVASMNTKRLMLSLFWWIQVLKPA